MKKIVLEEIKIRENRSHENGTMKKEKKEWQNVCVHHASK